MSCESCKEAMVIDEKEPPCWGEVGAYCNTPLQPGINACWLQELDEAGHRILEIRGKLIALKELVDPGTILRMYKVSLEEIELLAAVEEEMRKITPPPSKG